VEIDYIHIETVHLTSRQIGSHQEDRLIAVPVRHAPEMVDASHFSDAHDRYPFHQKTQGLIESIIKFTSKMV
jgi:hypothetical protein